MEEQRVERPDEFDGYDEESTHYLAYYGDSPAGTARWRKTDKGYKLERFAVYPELRRKGIASQILKQVLEDIVEQDPDAYLYLHAQLDAVPFYQAFGFKTKGDMFEECGIKHYTMVLESNL